MEYEVFEDADQNLSEDVNASDDGAMDEVVIENPENESSDTTVEDGYKSIGLIKDSEGNEVTLSQEQSHIAKNILIGVNKFFANDYIFVAIMIYTFIFLKKKNIIKKAFSKEKILFSVLMMFFVIMAISLPMQFKNGLFYYFYVMIAFVFFAEMKKNYKKLDFGKNKNNEETVDVSVEGK